MRKFSLSWQSGLAAFGLLVMTAGLAQAQEEAPVKATAVDGRTVLLYPDGSWRLDRGGIGRSGGRTPVAEPGEATAEETTPAETASSGEMESLESKTKIYRLSYDPAKWKLDTKSSNKAAEYGLDHTSGELFALIVAEKTAMPLETLKKAALANAKEAAPDAKIVWEEKRTVNGKNVICAQINGTIDGTKFVYYSYYASTKKGVVQVITYTTAEKFPERKEDSEELLAGLELL